MPTNIIKCRYCDWQTLRFRGKQRGEKTLRLHVLDEHHDEYQQHLGLATMDDDTPWTFDHDDWHEHPLS